MKVDVNKDAAARCYAVGLDAPAARGSNAAQGGLARRVERFVVEHPRLIPTLQAGTIAVYLALIVIPPWLPKPAPDATPWTDFVRFSQFAIWCIWWPFVLLSMIAFGRGWCGVLCPEGALAQAASRLGGRRRVPRWMSWGGIPLAAFVAITVIGQLVEVDEEPRAQLLILGGSTLAAVVVGLVYTRNARVWCRYLCPVSLLFGVFSRLGAMSFRVDRALLDAARGRALEPAELESAKKEPCPVFIHLPVLSTNRDCLMCFGCAGWRDAIHLELRRPGEEIGRIDRAQPLFWEVIFLFAGAIGLPLGVFCAEAFELSGLALLATLLGGVAGAASVLSLLTWTMARWLRRLHGDSVTVRDLFVRVGYAYAPLSLFSLFLGLSQPTFAYVQALGVPRSALDLVRAAVLAGGAVWSVVLAGRILRLGTDAGARVSMMMVPQLAGIALVLAGWAGLLWR